MIDTCVCCGEVVIADKKINGKKYRIFVPK